MRRILLLSLISLALVLSINYATGNLYSDLSDNVSYRTYNSDQNQTNDIVVSLFPNPLTDLQLTIESNNGIVEIEILDIVGKTIFKESFKSTVTRTVVDFKEFSKGYYIVKVSLEGKKFHTEKILFK